MLQELRQAVAVSLRRKDAGPGPRPYSACYAPSVQMYLYPTGAVRACCMNQMYPLGNVAEQRLTDIWNGPRRHELVRRLAVDDYSHGCTGCEWAIRVEGREGSYAELFDDRASYLTADPATAAWPRLMEFNLSNSCNLQCIQCMGELSSSIRIHREGLPPLPKVYGDEFFEDLREFIPHLELANFAGGEPFMGAENFRAWDLIGELKPELGVFVTTNATQWNKRVERVLEMLRVSPTFSIDGITRETYEAIRIDSDFDLVMANIDRFCDYAERVGTGVCINYCLMPQNHHEFGDMLLWAEARGILVNVSVVLDPAHASILRLPPDQIADVHRHLLADSDRVLAGLDLNATTWIQEVARIGSWVTGQEPDTDHEALWSGVRRGPFTFPLWGDGAHDATEARAALADFAGDGQVHELAIGAGDEITACPPSSAAALGIDSDAVVGRPVATVMDLVVERHGEPEAHELLAQTPDRIDAASTFADVDFRSSIVALRDDTGFGEQALLLFASRPR